MNQIALGVFVLANLFIGFRASRGIKSMRDYALAGKSLGGGVLVMTLIATILDSSSIGIRVGYARGVLGMIYPLSFSLATLLMGWFVFPQLVYFKKEYTVADIMHTIYGKWGRFFTVLASTLFSMLTIIAQLKVLGELGVLFGVNARLLIIFLGSWITLYTCIGGIRSVAATDVLQFVLTFASFLALGTMIFIRLGGINTILTKVPNPSIYLSFWHNPDIKKHLYSAFFWCMWPTLLIAPPVIQRVLMTPKKHQIRHMFLIFSFLYPFLRVLMLLVGLSLLITQPGKAIEKMDLGKVIALVCNNTIMQAFFVVGVCALIMSTIDSFLNALAVLWVQDVIFPLSKKKRGEIDSVLFVRYCSLLLGVLCIITTVFIKGSLFEIIAFAAVLFSVFLFPFVVGVMGLKGSPRAFLFAIFSFFTILFTLLGLVLFSKWEFAEKLMQLLLNFLQTSNKVSFSNSFARTIRILWFPSLLISILTFLAVHYIENGYRFVWVDFTAKNWKPKKKRYKLGISLDWLQHPVQWADACVRRYGKEPYLFGLFMYVCYMVPYTFSEVEQGGYWVIGLRLIGFLLCGILLAESIWPRSFRPYFNLFYLYTILYCVPFVGTLTAFLSCDMCFLVAMLLLSLMLLAVLVEWQAFLLLQSLGTIAALGVHRIVNSTFMPTFEGYHGWMLFFYVGYALLVLLLFVRKKQTATQQETTMLRRERDIHMDSLSAYTQIQRQLLSALDKRSSMMQLMASIATTLQQEKRQEEHRQLHNALVHLQQMAIKSAEHLPICPEPVWLSTFLDRMYYALQKIAIDPSVSITLDRKTEQERMVWDRAYLEALILGGMRVLSAQAQGQKLLFVLEDTVLDYGLDRKTPALRIVLTNAKPCPSKEASYMPSTENSMLIQEENQHLAKNIQIIKAHYGFVAISGQGDIYMQEYVLPYDIQSVRPKIPYFADEDLFEKTMLDASEDVALLAVAKAQGLDVDRVARALKAAKFYHRHQTRKSGEKYYTHPLAVALILLEHISPSMVQDHVLTEDLLIAGLLHDTVEDTAYTHQQLVATFGLRVAKIVGSVTHLYSGGARKIKFNKQEHLDTLAETEDRLALMVKLADRVHNLRTIQGHPSRDKQRAIAEETQILFIPAAERQGFLRLAEELRKHCKKILK